MPDAVQGQHLADRESGDVAQRHRQLVEHRGNGDAGVGRRRASSCRAQRGSPPPVSAPGSAASCLRSGASAACGARTTSASGPTRVSSVNRASTAGHVAPAERVNVGKRSPGGRSAARGCEAVERRLQRSRQAPGEFGDEMELDRRRRPRRPLAHGHALVAEDCRDQRLGDLADRRSASAWRRARRCAAPRQAGPRISPSAVNTFVGGGSLRASARASSFKRLPAAAGMLSANCSKAKARPGRRSNA